VVTTVGGDTRLVTKVVQGATPDEVVLVGGGDELLGTGRSHLDQTVGHAGLGTLAAQVAGALKASSRTQVVVRFDDSVLEGPNVSPTWDPSDVKAGYTGRVSALGLVRDRARLGHPSPVDPSASAAAAFATALRHQGIQVTGTPQRSRADAGAAELGRVESATVGDVLGEALQHSDNALAELLARLTAKQLGRSTTFEDGAVAVMDQVQRLGVDTRGTRIVDGSGLGRGSVVAARTLAQVLTLAASDREPRLRPLLAGLPVAGFSGTLSDRFLASTSHRAAGVVRAKTGTLTGVSALAGVTVDADGRLLVFVLMADHVPVGGTLDARAAADRAAAAVAGCGCR
jgi:D-alanyl-D-alanine carboxypeptidase/D-alanyl-D-alanine-endopeptidase (penicillin-binding protein 4)